MAGTVKADDTMTTTPTTITLTSTTSNTTLTARNVRPADGAAARLLHARRHGVAVPAPLIDDAEAAYAAQRDVAAAQGWFDGAPPRHWKSGGPSPAAQTHGALPPGGVSESPAIAPPWPAGARWIEAEIALRLGEPVDAATAATLDMASAAHRVDAMCVSIEIVESRWAEALDAPPLAKLADLQSHGSLVLGDWVPFAPRDWREQTCRVRIGGHPAVECRGTHSMGDPAAVLPAWLRHATRDGTVLPAGTVVTTGTWVGMLEARRGDRVDVRFDGIGDAQVQL
jgi:2-keto-4-pentenoate hydratase